MTETQRAIITVARTKPEVISQIARNPYNTRGVKALRDIAGMPDQETGRMHHRAQDAERDLTDDAIAALIAADREAKPVSREVETEIDRATRTRGAATAPITTAPELFERTDWKMLRRQKRIILKACAGFELTANDREGLQGLLAFIDAVQDLAHDHYGHKVFPDV